MGLVDESFMIEPSEVIRRHVKCAANDVELVERLTDMVKAQRSTIISLSRMVEK